MARVDFILPDDVFEAAEKIRLGGKSALTQGQFYRLAVEEYVRLQTAARQNDYELDAFLSKEETEEELMEWVREASLLTLADSPWDEDLA